MNNDTLKNSREDALTPSQPEQVNRSGRTSSPVLIVSEPGTIDNRRLADTLAAVYRLILSPEWGQP